MPGVQVWAVSSEPPGDRGCYLARTLRHRAPRWSIDVLGDALGLGEGEHPWPSDMRHMTLEEWQMCYGNGPD